MRNQSRLFAVDIVCITLLFFSFLAASTFQLFPEEILTALHILTVILVLVILLSIAWKGVVPLIICVLGVVLMYNSIILPLFASSETGQAMLGDRRIQWAMYFPGAIDFATKLHFFLGASMVVFSRIIAYKPSILFARNRPTPEDKEWSEYPVWYDNAVLADGRSEPAVPVKSLVTDMDRYLLWRYEYILANIYGTPHLVNPLGLVPRDSTTFFRDKASGRIIGKARYTGFFM